MLQFKFEFDCSMFIQSTENTAIYSIKDLVLNGAEIASFLCFLVDCPCPLSFAILDSHRRLSISLIRTNTTIYSNTYVVLVLTMFNPHAADIQ